MIANIFLPLLAALCILQGDFNEEYIEITVGPEMNTADYHKLKTATGNQDLSPGEFLSLLKQYCPEQLYGLEEININDDVSSNAIIKPTQPLYEAIYAQAWEEAQRELAEWKAAQPVPKPESGLGILYYNNGWRQDADGYWRGESGQYAPWSVGHDATAHTGNNGVAWSIPSTQPINEFMEPTSTQSGGGWWQWIVSFCGTVVIVMLVVGLLIAIGFTWLRNSGKADEKLAAKMAARGV